MKTLPLTVLAYEGPQARAYLLAMRERGWQPQRVLLMVLDHHPATGKKTATWLPRKLRAGLCRAQQEAALMYWPRSLRRSHPAVVAAVTSACEPLWPGRATAMVDAIAGAHHWPSQGSQFEQMLVSGYKDERLHRRLAELAEAGTLGPVLYTGGGIVPKALLDIPGVRLLHIHPGHLPDVRGADGLLWSMLIRGRPGASCFWMAPGIDVGDLIVAREFEPLALDLPTSAAGLSLYRALFASYDPLLRARLLVDDVLAAAEPYEQLTGRPQSEDDGLTYHFLHEALRNEALRRLCAKG